MDKPTIEDVLEEIRALRADLAVASKGVLNLGEAAGYLGMSQRTLHMLWKAGKIKRVEMSEGRIGYRRQELDRFLADSESTCPDAVIDEVGKQYFDEAKSTRTPVQQGGQH